MLNVKVPREEVETIQHHNNEIGNDKNTVVVVVIEELDQVLLEEVDLVEVETVEVDPVVETVEVVAVEIAVEAETKIRTQHNSYLLYIPKFTYLIM